MARFSDNYYLRKCYFDTETVPTQSVMKDKMCTSLAKVYFTSMNRKLKVLAGLEPPLKGGGADWFIPPGEVLDGRLVMKPVANETLKKLGFNGIAFIGDWLMERHHKRMEAEKNKVLLESDINWKKTIEVSCRQQLEDSSYEAAASNTRIIQKAFQEFSLLYSTSITQIETVLFDSAVKDIEAARDETYQKMQAHYEKLLQDQAMMLYDRYDKKLKHDKANRKSNFIRAVEEVRLFMGRQIHDIKLEKHIVVEKLRQLQESLNLACQMYVMVKEREECKKEMDLSKHKQEKKVKALKEEIEMKDFEIRLAIEKEKKCEELHKIWKKKVCEVVKKLQIFSSFCLKELPDHSDFFIDMEKLMMLQLSQVIENPKAESIIEPEAPLFTTPVARPHAFYLCCDTGYPQKIDQNLCPKHCTSSASQLPVVVVNKRFIYASCDNFEKFTDKIENYIHYRDGKDADFEDHHVYEHDVPVKLTNSMQLLDLKLESSLMQIMQKELPNVRGVPTACCVCNIPYCFCSPSTSFAGSKKDLPKATPKSPSVKNITPVKPIDSRSVELAHDREPKWQSYMDYVMPTNCRCGKRAKKHLDEHLPAYMKTMSKYQEPILPHYEMCPLPTLKRLVKKARGYNTPPPVQRVVSKTHDVATQYSDQAFEYICTCFSEEEVKKLFRELAKSASIIPPESFKVVGDEVPNNHLERHPGSFAMECAHDLRKILDDAPQLEEIFKKEDCEYDVKGLVD